ncbi:MAG: hypothetical protein H7A21_18745 [Spirochaetales bacterium]|nr:hypothetical protein [Spirochaetales bacterium]MCP5486531.1 hypothetical protein [Spirochaetales bacterium]
MNARTSQNEEIMRTGASTPTTTEIERSVALAVEEARPVSLVTYFLTDRGEGMLHAICRALLEARGRPDLLDIVYTAAKELILNGTKANVKRVLFREQGLDAANEADYRRGMDLFKGELREERIAAYRSRFKEYDLPVTATFYGNPLVLNIKVKNNFPLLPQEEQRIREKFDRAQSFSSLIDFYTEHADESEGAGLGLTMVGLLLDESGIDKHAFTLYSNPIYGETAARLEIPLSDEYVPKRKRFEIEREEHDLSSDEFRRRFRVKTSLY